MIETYNRLPTFLQNYCAVQYYERYTAQDQAVWRYALRQLVDFLSHHAVPVYRDGLRKTGISLEEIPRIEDMDHSTLRVWLGSCSSRGFYSTDYFFWSFRHGGVLPIAVDIRRFGHLSYTPAPDIIHEAAGHAPIIADPEICRVFDPLCGVGAEGNFFPTTTFVCMRLSVICRTSRRCVASARRWLSQHRRGLIR